MGTPPRPSMPSATASPPRRFSAAFALAALAAVAAVVLLVAPREAAAGSLVDAMAMAEPGSALSRFTRSANCECGQTGENVGVRIVGGSIAMPHLYPYMVAILNRGNMHCGGSIINDRYVLTAGHCLNGQRRQDLTVVLGMHDRAALEEGTDMVIECAELILHEQFSSDYLHDTDDIGLIRLKTPVKYTRYASPVCLPPPNGDWTNKVAMVTGWGRTAQNGNPSRYLRKASVRILSQDACRNTSIGEHIMDNMMCAYEFETDACQGDSGGPLVFEAAPGKIIQIGVVSWGIGCAKPGMPGVYVRLTEYLDWIKKHTSDAIWCDANM